MMMGKDNMLSPTQILQNQAYLLYFIVHFVEKPLDVELISISVERKTIVDLEFPFVNADFG